MEKSTQRCSLFDQADTRLLSFSLIDFGHHVGRSILAFEQWICFVGSRATEFRVVDIEREHWAKGQLRHGDIMRSEVNFHFLV